MSVDHGDRLPVDAGSAQQGEVARRLAWVEPRRFRGTEWLPADEVREAVRLADERIGLLLTELERQRRENQSLVNQVEMLRHGALPSTSTQGPDPLVVEFAMRAQEDVNRTLGEASAESAEIISAARRQGEAILAEAHRRAAGITGSAETPSRDVPGRVRELEERHAAMVAVVSAAQRQLSQWQAYLGGQADQLRSDAAAAEGLSEQLRAVLVDGSDAEVSGQRAW